MFKQILKPIIKSSRVLYRLYLWFSVDEKFRKTFGLIYDPLDLNNEYYNRIKKLGDSELEHQIGRLINFKKIIKTCRTLQGDFIEFGVWQGFSLLWTAYFLERNAIFTKKLIALDGFDGLPYADGIFDKFAFSNTSINLCKKNIFECNLLYPMIKRNIIIEKFWYHQKNPILNFLKKNKVTKFCFIHIDCDVSESAREIFKILIEGDLIADKCYILFDDYGCKTNLKQTIDSVFKKLKSNWLFETHSSTKLTRNFLLIRK